MDSPSVLRLAEASTLHRFLTDVEMMNALDAFCKFKCLENEESCTAEMQRIPQEIEKAKKFAFFAMAYQEMLQELKDFSKDQLAKAAG